MHISLHFKGSTSEKRRKLVQAQEDDFEKTQIPFYLSTAEGIEDRFNGRNVAFGITGMFFDCFKNSTYNNKFN